MGLWSLLTGRRKTRVARLETRAGGQRRSRFELLEERRLMDADPIKIGVVYIEQDGGSDLHGDTFEIMFQGGAANTELTQLVIDGDHGATGLTVGDMIFDTIHGGLGADEAFNLQVVSSTGIQNVSWQVSDGGTKLTLNFQGFHAGEKLVFTIDVDEVQDFDPGETNQQTINEGIDPIASGVEFQGSQLTGKFHAPHFHDVQGTSEFRNLYDPLFNGSNLLVTQGNPGGLPNDDFQGKRDRSTGTLLGLQQHPLPITIGGKVFADNDRDLVQDAADPNISGVTLSLWKKVSGQWQNTGHTAQTDSQGNYLFGLNLNLQPGVYQVREAQPAGYFSVGAIPGNVSGMPTGVTVAGDPDVLTEINIPLGDTHAVRYDFAEAQPASIRGRVHLTDREGNCFTQEALNRPLAGVKVTLKDALGNIIGTTLTNANGEYEFTNLMPGTYSIVEETPPGLLDGGDHVGVINGIQVGQVSSNDVIESIVLHGGQHGANYDFCEKEPAMVAGFVYYDKNDNGLFDSGEAAIPGTTVILLDAGGKQVAQTTSDGTGFYKFANLSAGTYAIKEVQPAGFLDGKDTPGTIAGIVVGTADSTADKLSGVVLLYGDSGVNYNFGELKAGSIAGRVWVDPDEDIVLDAGETLLAGVTIELLGANGNVLRTTTTNAQGQYHFGDLAPGVYAVREQQPTGYLQGGQKAGSHGGNASVTDLITQLVVGPEEHLIQYDFCELLPVSIAGLVWADRDGDCLYDAGESPIAGVTIHLLDASGNVVRTTTTDGQGEYQFDGLAPGAYSVQEIQPAGYFDGDEVLGSHGGVDTGNDLLASVVLQSGDNAINYNFCELLPVSIGGRVFSDTNSNCDFDEGESPLAGVTVQLLDGQGNFIRAMQTSGQGRYQFNNLPPGTYTVRELQPAGYFDGGEQAGSHGGDDTQNDLIRNVTLLSGDNATDYDFCEKPPASLSGYVFRDGAAITTEDGTLPTNLYELRDGKLTPDDLRLKGVVLELRHTLTGEPVLGEDCLPGAYPPGPVRVRTDATGFYQFKGLKSGNYSVFEVHPEGYIDSIDTAGTTNGLAINAGTLVSPLVLQRFAMQGVSFRFDAILQIPLAAGQHSTLNNFSEVQVVRFTIPPLDREPPPELPVTRDPFWQPPPVFIPANFFIPPQPQTIVTGGSSDWTWHLSIIDAGLPRAGKQSTRVSDVVWRPALLVDKTEWQPSRLRQGIWTIHTAHEVAGDEGPRAHVFGIPGAIPIVGDWNGDGRSEIGLFYKGEWFLDLNGNGHWDAEDLWAKLGFEGDRPVVGDWDGDGKDDIGIFGPEWAGDPRHIENEPGLPDSGNVRSLRPKNQPPNPDQATEGERLMRLTAKGQERADLIDHVFRFGGSTDVPIAGDWNGDGIRSVGIFHNGKWHFDMDGDGRWSAGDQTAHFGQQGDIPVVGDFNGDGIEEIGIYRAGKWFIDTNGNRQIDSADRQIELGSAADKPVVGDWNGDGADEPGLYREETAPRDELEG
ncbi:MAG: SdrD B-like domain-containing protein [Pirellulaceae bacterium]